MKHQTIAELTNIADVVTAASKRENRRQRLERLATLIEEHSGPLRLLSQIEYLPHHTRHTLRADRSPLSIAFNDPILRGQGLASDQLGDSMAFFGLSSREAHHLLCDCHYWGARPASSADIAARARSLANRFTLTHLWDTMRSIVTAHF